MLSVPAAIAPVRLAIEQRCAAAGFDEKACGEIGLCVNEALANVICHAYGNLADRPIDVTMSIDGSADPCVVIALRDWGSGVNPLDLPTPAKVLNPLIPGGIGFICLREFMDSIVFERQSDGMLLTLCRFRDRKRERSSNGCNCGSVKTRGQSRGSVVTSMDELNPGTPLLMNARKDGDAVLASVKGDIDLHNSPELREGLIELLTQANPTRMILNLSEVPYMDSSAIAVLVEMLQRLRKVGGKIFLTNLHPRVQSLLQIARLDTIFVVKATEEESMK